MIDSAPSVIVVGAGGHAKVIIGALQALGRLEITVYDDNPAKWNTLHLGCPVRGPIERLSEDDGLETILAVGDGLLRQKLAEQYPHRRWATVVHPHAWVHQSATLEHGTVVFAGAVIQPSVSIGAHVIVNTGATVDHDCSIGDFAHLAPGVHLAGTVTLGRQTMLGMGAVANPGITIGDFSIIGAGGTVVRDIPAGVIATGCPAHVVRQREMPAGV